MNFRVISLSTTTRSPFDDAGKYFERHVRATRLLSH